MRLTSRRTAIALAVFFVVRGAAAAETAAYAIEIKMYYFAAINGSNKIERADVSGIRFSAKNFSIDSETTNLTIGAAQDGGEMTINKITMRFADNDISLVDASCPNAKEIDPLVDGRVKLLAAPRVTVKAEDPASIEITQPVQYFTRDEDGVFSLHSTNVGVTSTCVVKETSEKGWIEAKWKSQVDRIVERTPIPDVSLNIGPLVVAKATLDETRHMQLGKWSLSVVTEKDGAIMLQAARITRQKDEKK